MQYVVIRVDASTAIGTGHLKRCLSLAEALKTAGAQVQFVVRAIDAVAPQVLHATDWPVRWLPVPTSPCDLGASPDLPPCAGWAGVSWEQDARETAAALGEHPPDWLILDHYAFDARWHRSVRNALGCKLLVIDDTADRAIDADVVLDHNWHANHRQKYQGRLQREPRWLVGPRYALLSPAYRDAPRYVFHAEVRSIGIFMGGTDLGGISAKVLSACRQGGFTGEIEVVSTSANPHLNELRAACADSPGTQLTLDQPDLTSFFARHDLQIGAGGGATWERCCIGVPSMGLVLSANQSVVVPLLDRAGILRAARLNSTAGDDTPLFPWVLRELIQGTKTRRQMADRAAALVDGRGAQRVALSLLNDTLQLRPVRMEDATLLHAWRNHPSVRAVSGNPDAITFEDHHRWLQHALNTDGRWLFIAQVGALPVGSIRFDQLSSQEVDVSLYLDPDLSGLGLGARMLLAGELAMHRNLGADFRVAASVMPGNAASQRMFESCRYHGGPLSYQKLVATQPTVNPSRP